MTLNALTVDMEEYFHATNLEGSFDRSRWELIPSRIAEPTFRMLSIFDELGIRATFFVLGWIAERHAKLVHSIAERGHEIACHGYAHELVYHQGPNHFRDDLRRARVAIEDATGIQVVGYRAPSFSITEQSLWALEILAEEGFTFDSSIFPVRHPRYGISSFEREPVRLLLDSGMTIVEFPLTTLAVGPINIPLAGGAYLRFFPFNFFRFGYQRVARSGRATVFYVHPWELDSEQPRADVNSLVSLNHYFNLSKVEARMKGMLESLEFYPMRDVLLRLEDSRRIPTKTIERFTHSRATGRTIPRGSRR